MATEIQCTPPERQSSVFVTKKAEGARRALPLLPTSRVVRHARRNLACKLIEGAHGQRGQIISAGRRVLVEGLSQQVHVLDCASSMMARVSPFSATPHCLGGPTLLVRRRSGQLCAMSQLPQTWHPMYPHARTGSAARLLVVTSTRVVVHDASKACLRC
jgi:hypothetical protein